MLHERWLERLSDPVRCGLAAAAGAAVAQLPVMIGGAVALARRRRRRPREAVERRDRRRLAAKADRVERTLARVQDRDHELRATLSSLRLVHELLVARRAALSRATRSHLQRLLTAELERAERQVSARPRPEVTEVDLAEVIDPLVEATALKGCAVRWQGTGSRVCGRADDITEIVHVLLDNAARHAAGGDVTVTVTTSPGWVDVRVQDSGPGVPGALAQVVFERGVRGATSEGEGIGLHIARRRAQDLSGDLWLEPPRSPGAPGGAAFVLRLPEATGLAPCLAPAV